MAPAWDCGLGRLQGFSVQSALTTAGSYPSTPSQLIRRTTAYAVRVSGYILPASRASAGGSSDGYCTLPLAAGSMVSAALRGLECACVPVSVWEYGARTESVNREQKHGVILGQQREGGSAGTASSQVVRSVAGVRALGLGIVRSPSSLLLHMRSATRRRQRAGPGAYAPAERRVEPRVPRRSVLCMRALSPMNIANPSGTSLIPSGTS